MLYGGDVYVGEMSGQTRKTVMTVTMLLYGGKGENTQSTLED